MLGSPAYLAMKLWRNYDGSHSGFGDTSVGASVGNPDQADAFAALRSTDGALTVAVVNKNFYDAANPSATTSVTINLSNFAGSGVAQEWQLAAINPGDQTKAAITHLADVHFSGNSVTLTVPIAGSATGTTSSPTRGAVRSGRASRWSPRARRDASPLDRRRGDELLGRRVGALLVLLLDPQVHLVCLLRLPDRFARPRSQPATGKNERLQCMRRGEIRRLAEGGFDRLEHSRPRVQMRVDRPIIVTDRRL